MNAQVLTVIESLGIPLPKVRIWDETVGVIDAEDLVVDDQDGNILAEHVTPPGNAACLCYYLQHWFPDDGTGIGSLYPLPATNGRFWRVDINDKALPNLDQFREIRNPWYTSAGIVVPSVYFTASRAARQTWRIRYFIGAAQADYVVAGRIIGFDFPQVYWDRVASPGKRL